MVISPRTQNIIDDLYRDVSERIENWKGGVANNPKILHGDLNCIAAMVQVLAPTQLNPYVDDVQQFTDYLSGQGIYDLQLSSSDFPRMDQKIASTLIEYMSDGLIDIKDFVRFTNCSSARLSRNLKKIRDSKNIYISTIKGYLPLYPSLVPDLAKRDQRTRSHQNVEVIKPTKQKETIVDFNTLKKIMGPDTLPDDVWEVMEVNDQDARVYGGSSIMYNLNIFRQKLREYRARK